VAFKKIKNRNIEDGCVIFTAAAALLWHSLAEHYRRPGVEWKMSPSLFPVLVSAALLILAAALCLEGLAQIRREKEAPPRGEAPLCAQGKQKPVLLTLVLSAAYYGLLRLIGFIPATVLFLGALLYLLGERRHWLVALVAVASALGIYAVFGLALGVMLP
jgi:hypothetical protein